MTQHHIHFIVSAELYNRLRAESIRTGAPMAELIRRAIEKAHPKKGSK